MQDRRIGAAALLMLAGCAVDDATGPQVAVAPMPTPTPVSAPVGVARVIGEDAAGLARLFGAPDAEVREGPGRKLQFAGPICVLDAYLYPSGSAPPRVTWLDARQPDGGPIDRASCIAALVRRDEAR